MPRAPTPLREVLRKLGTLGCTCEQRPNKWKVTRIVGGRKRVAHFETTHGRRTPRDQVPEVYCQKLRLKLRISRGEWDEA